MSSLVWLAKVVRFYQEYSAAVEDRRLSVGRMRELRAVPSNLGILWIEVDGWFYKRAGAEAPLGRCGRDIC